MAPAPLARTLPNVGLTGRRYDFAAVSLILIFVALIYGARLGRQPIVGEESRWANGAREMLRTGDWIVPRQQGRVFPERPPMTMWAMAATGWLRGKVDPIAIRLPSVIAVALTSLLIYAYARALLSPIAAVIAALVYASMGQVLQIGRLGESEALFALFVSASLLLWHLGYTRGWRPLATWCAGFGFAGLAALVKGPQAPIYFVAITAMYLLVRRDWRYLVRWQFAAGGLVFVGIVAGWQVPFYLATDWPAVVATWSGLAADRIHLSGLAKHFVSYPIETFACLLPWSPLLVALAKRETRTLLLDDRGVTTFLFTALLVAYPTVWTAAGARGRYFMPLYPIAAVLIGLLIERCAAASIETYPRRAWRQFLLLTASLIAVAGAILGVSGLMPGDGANWLHQPRWFEVVFAIAAACAASMLWTCFRERIRITPVAAVTIIAVFVGAAFAGLMVNVNSARWNNPAGNIAALKSNLPAGAQLVSLSPIEHRFAYFFETPIVEHDWPLAIEDLPPDVEYFCFMRHAGDTAESRAAGRGRTWTTTPGTLPFAWDELTTICVERKVRAEAPRVVIAKVLRPLRSEMSDVTRPQAATALRRDSAVRH